MTTLRYIWQHLDLCGYARIEMNSFGNAWIYYFGQINQLINIQYLYMLFVVFCDGGQTKSGNIFILTNLLQIFENLISWLKCRFYDKTNWVVLNTIVCRKIKMQVVFYIQKFYGNQIYNLQLYMMMYAPGNRPPVFSARPNRIR